MPKEIRRKRKVIVGMVGGTVLAGWWINRGYYSNFWNISSKWGGMVYQEKLKIFNWPESYCAISTLLNINNDLYVGTSNGVYKIKDNASNTKDKIMTSINGINGYISSLVVTNDGTIYVATFFNFVEKYGWPKIIHQFTLKILFLIKNLLKVTLFSVKIL